MTTLIRCWFRIVRRRVATDEEVEILVAVPVFGDAVTMELRTAGSVASQVVGHGLPEAGGGADQPLCFPSRGVATVYHDY